MGFYVFLVLLNLATLSPASGNLQWLAMPEDKDDLKAKLQSVQGNMGPTRQPTQGEFRHTDMEAAHQHILYLETKVRAMEELDSWNLPGMGSQIPMGSHGPPIPQFWEVAAKAENGHVWPFGGCSFLFFWLELCLFCTKML